MDGLETLMLRRRVELIEAILERAGIVDLVIGHRPWPGDPGPEDISRGRLGALSWWRGPRPGPTPDPAVTDIARLGRAELEATLHQIAAERARLDSVEGLVKEQLQKGG